jgi:glutathione peroxidase
MVGVVLRFGNPVWTAYVAISGRIPQTPSRIAPQDRCFMDRVYDYSAKALDGKEVSLATFTEQVLLIVNTASACGFTPQYSGLETLYRAHAARGFSVLGFPCNQFGKQEPGSEAEIAEFCSREYSVTFPMFAKIEVNGDNAHPLYRFLKRQRPGLMGLKSIKWNFTKFLVDREGQVVTRYAPMTRPEALTAEILSLL